MHLMVMYRKKANCKKEGQEVWNKLYGDKQHKEAGRIEGRCKEDENILFTIVEKK